MLDDVKYINFGVVFRVDDLDDGSFYIGQTTSKKKWNNGYLGSGKIWRKHLKKHPPIERYPEDPNAHRYKRSVLHEGITNQKTLSELELQEILRFAEQKEDGSWRIANPDCKNISCRLQGEHVACEEVCSECGGKAGLHKDSCSKSKGKCPECGYSLTSHRHAKDCSRRKPIKQARKCQYCGSTTGPHRKLCPLYEPPKEKPSICSECGGKRGRHYKTCSKAPRCPECGYPTQSARHAKDCSQYEPIQPCSECGCVCGHYKSCSKMTKRNKVCSECGGKDGKHYKDCSQFVSRGSCPECGGGEGHHLKSCSRGNWKPCPHCGSVTNHKSSCPKFKVKPPCPECDGLNGKHKKPCPLNNPSS